MNFDLKISRIGMFSHAQNMPNPALNGIFEGNSTLSLVKKALLKIFIGF